VSQLEGGDKIDVVVVGDSGGSAVTFEFLSLEEYEEYCKLESKLYVAVIVSLKYVLDCHTQHGRTGKENVVEEPMVRQGSNWTIVTPGVFTFPWNLLV
jgi:hypothetical protein